MRTLSLVLLLTACGTNSPDDTGNAADTSTIAPPSQTDPNDTAESAPQADLQLSLTLTDGTPLEAVEVSLCALICQVKETDAQGAVTFTTEARPHSLHLNPSDADLAEVLFPVDFVADEVKVLSASIPALGAPIDLGTSAELEPADDLLLTVGAGDLSIPLDPSTITAIRGVSVSADLAPPVLIDGAIVQPTRLWYLAPYQAKASGGSPIRVRNSWNASPGDSFSVYTASYTSFAFKASGTLTVNSDGTYLEGDATALEFTTVALIKD